MLPDRLPIPIRFRYLRPGFNERMRVLVLVDRIVEAHHGRLELVPNPDGGLTATVSLPRAVLDA
jgi:hypothetical protein